MSMNGIDFQADQPRHTCSYNIRGAVLSGGLSLMAVDKPRRKMYLSY